jgi:hypothetical protein
MKSMLKQAVISLKKKPYSSLQDTYFTNAFFALLQNCWPSRLFAADTNVIAGKLIAPQRILSHLSACFGNIDYNVSKDVSITTCTS